MSSKVVINKFKRGKINNSKMAGSLELLALNQVYEQKLISDKTYHCVKEKIIKEYKLLWNDLYMLGNRVTIHTVRLIVGLEEICKSQ